MLKRWLKCLPAGMVLAAVVLTLLWLGRPQSFAEFAPVEQSSEFYIYTTSAQTGSHEFREARPDLEEMTLLLELLETGSLRLKGRSRFIQWDAEETLFHLSFYHGEDDRWVEDAGFDLCTDSMVYVHHDWLGYLHYQLTGCEMDAVETELLRLLSISQNSSE